MGKNNINTIAKLVKKAEGWYNLYDGEIGIGSTHEDLQGHKLSKQNCDEIFGVVDVEKLAEEFVNDLQVASESVNRAVKLGYEEGFNKAMELNKDKEFNLEDMRKAFNQNPSQTNRPFNEFIESLQQPTEIEVEIEVTKSDDIKSVEKDWYKIGEPKLDSEGCLIIKKI